MNKNYNEANKNYNAIIINEMKIYNLKIIIYET